MRTTHFIAQARTTCVATALLCLLYCLMFSSPLEPVYTSPPDEEDSDDRLFPHMFFPRPPPYSTPIQPPPYSTPIKPPSHDQGHVHGVYHGSKDVDEKPRQHTRDARARDDIVPGRFFDNNKHIAQVRETVPKILRHGALVMKVYFSFASAKTWTLVALRSCAHHKSKRS